MKKLLAVAIVPVLGCAVLWGRSMLHASADPQQANSQPTTAAQKKESATTQADKARDEKAILEAVYDYMEAFNRGDANAVAKHFTEQAEVVDDSGDIIQGRDAIGKAYAALLQKSPGAKLDIAIEYFRWLAPDVIVGHGTVKLTPKDGKAASTSYTAVHVKQDGQWRIAMVREAVSRLKPAKTRDQHLQELAWLVGDWVDSDDSGTLKIHCKWSRNKAYLTRSFTVTTKEGVALEGTEIIGWDPARNVLRSWVFDTNGGFSEGVWQHRGPSWQCKLAGVQSDGRKASAVHVFTPKDDHYTFRSVSRTLDGEVQPDIDNVKVKRISQGDK